MDYCHPCQRHLNGALACAGCGTPADALAPYAVSAAPARPGRDEGPARETSAASEATGHRRRAPEVPPRRRGRRGHRRRGRTLLLTATGVVLAVGALSLAELAIEPGGDSGAAEYVSEATDTATGSAPVASSGVEPDDAGPVDAPTVVPVTASRSGETEGKDGDGGDGSATPGASASATRPGSPSPSASSSDPDGPAGTEGPSDPSHSTGPTAEPTSPAPSDDPTPTPSPSETCTPWLWWCV
ncbi:hypothetical protein OG206_22685 [Streptomyces sp. NBC_01341]|uniref:SCO2400 family protein n=1 Tax=Streptomyces sp. NBC_01341 TaxID=2903831 RepID=UPI002E108178|nr:hypothetical protein OG206_22685 [Streptomyces sp. NBC_01341]